MATTIDSDHAVYNMLTLDTDKAMPDRMPILSITFVPGLADNVCVLKEADENGMEVFHELCIDLGSVTRYYYGRRIKLFFDVSASTITAGALIIIVTDK